MEQTQMTANVRHLLSQARDIQVQVCKDIKANILPEKAVTKKDLLYPIQQHVVEGKHTCC